MKQTLTFYALACLVVLFWSAPAISADMSELERKIDILSDELDDLKEGDMLKGQRVRSRKFQQSNLVKIFGYGEMHLDAPLSGSNVQSVFDQHRYVIGVHAILAKWIDLTSEIDFEHAAQERELF